MNTPPRAHDPASADHGPDDAAATGPSGPRGRLPLRTSTLLLLLSLLLGAIVGAIVWVFLLLMDGGLTLLWEVVPEAVDVPWLPLVVCALGGVVIGLYERRFGRLPESMETVMDEVREKGGYAWGEGRLARGAVGALLPLVFGGSLGPEAGLTGMVAGLCTWVGDHLKTAGHEAREFTTMGISATLGALFSAPLYGLVAPFEDRSGEFVFSRGQRVVGYLLALAGGLGVMWGLQGLFGGGMGLPRFEAFPVTAADLVWMVPLCLAGTALGWLYHAADRLSERFSSLFGAHVVLRAVVCGLVLGGLGMLLPLTMFAGESQAQTVIGGWASMGAMLLLATGLVKTCLTPFCIECGWRGGNIFPLIFSGICVGYALAALSGATPGLAVCLVVASLCGAVMRRPLGVIALLLLCFPLRGVVFLGLAAVIGAKVPLPRPLRPRVRA